MKHDAEAASKAAVDAGGNAKQGVKGAATWVAQKVGVSKTSIDEDGIKTTGIDTVLVKPVGILTSEESRLTGKRYADRPDGIDQFGGEDIERDL